MTSSGVSHKDFDIKHSPICLMVAGCQKLTKAPVALRRHFSVILLFVKHFLLFLEIIHLSG